jgi:hypothetical protein
MAIRIRTGLRANLPASAVLGQPLFCTDTGEFFVGTGTGVVPVSATAAWATIASGTNANHLTIGSGGILDHSGTGVIDANKFSGVALLITTLASGDVLRYNGTNWVNHAFSFADIAGSITAGQEPATTVNAVTNDTNIHGSIFTQNLTLSWAGLLGLARGGTNADLSATGGAHQVLRQSSSGAAVTVGQLASTDLSDSSSLVILTGSQTLTDKRVTPRIVSLVDATSFTLDTDNADQCTQVNTQAAGTLTANAPSGSPTEGQKIIFRIKSTNVQTYSWNAVFRGSTSVVLPTASSGGGLTDYLGFIYNNPDSKWDLVAYDAGH